MADRVRILFLADTHLGFDLPVKPRVERRRRGHDFLANYAAALQPALDGAVDLVVHGGDVFNRSHVPTSLAWQAFEPLVQVADRGVPVYIVPGNHERSRLPHLRFAQHPRVHVFDRPRTFVVDVRGTRVALVGVPFERHDARTGFASALEQSEWRELPADVRLLCLHQCVEGATVGPGNYRFTTASDVLRGRDIPPQMTAVLSGHIHRHQVLTHDLRGKPLPSPVLYPGSIERTSLAEADEPKGFLLVTVVGRGDAARVEWEFRPLPARPLIVRDLHVASVAADDVALRLSEYVAGAPPDAVLTIRVIGAVSEDVAPHLAARRLRELAPPTMNVELRFPRDEARAAAP